MLAHHERGLADADALGRHDLVGLGILQHAVLVDAALVREGVPADDRLVVLHRERGDGRDALRGSRQHRGLDARRVRADVAAGLQRHDDLFQRRIAGALADAVDRALDLPGAGLDAGQRIGDREAEVVVAMDREHGLVGARHAVAHVAEHGRIFSRRRVTHRVGQVDRGRAGADRGFDAAAQIVERRAGGVHGRPFHVLDEAAGLRHRAGDDLQHLGFGLAHLMREVDGRGRHEGMDAGRRAWRTAAPARAMSPSMARASPATVARDTRRAISETASKSPSEAIGKPASMMSTPMSSSNAASSILSSNVMVAPGHCSPSRKVVSKIKTRSAGEAGDGVMERSWSGKRAMQR